MNADDSNTTKQTVAAAPQAASTKLAGTGRVPTKPTGASRSRGPEHHARDLLPRRSCPTAMRPRKPERHA